MADPTKNKIHIDQPGTRGLFPFKFRLLQCDDPGARQIDKANAIKAVYLGMKDSEIRQVLLSDLSREFQNAPDTVIIEELGLCQGDARVKPRGQPLKQEKLVTEP